MWSKTQTDNLIEILYIALKQKRMSPQQNEPENEENDEKNKELSTCDRYKFIKKINFYRIL